MSLIKKTLTEKLGKALLILGFFLLIFAAVIFLGSDNIKADKIGQFGDLVGGLIGSIWALAGVILFYIALTEQRKDFATNRKVLDAQTEALKLQLEEFKLQRQELSETREIFKIQKFETSFFNLLKFHNEATKDLSIRFEKSNNIKKEKDIRIFDGVKFFGKGEQLIENYLYELKTLEIIIGQNKDDSLISYLKNKTKKDLDFARLITDIANKKGPLLDQKIAFLLFFNDFRYTLNKYMQQLLMLVNFIDKSSTEIEGLPSEIYISLLKAQLSELELKFIWIYCHSFQRTELELLTKYSIIPSQVSLFKPVKYNS
jgi:hypothetical protein